MSDKYIGITIGPIYETMILSSTPASLWGSSYLFSFIAKEICLGLVHAGVCECRFISPYFAIQNGDISYKLDDVDASQIAEAGVGLFHDRIIYKDDDILRAQNIIDLVKRNIASHFPHAQENYFNEYLQIYAVCIDVNTNPILEVSKVLDACELQKNFVISEGTNPLLELFINTDGNKEIEGKNYKIKKSFLVGEKRRNRWLLSYTQGERPGYGDNSIKDTAYIALGGVEEKNAIYKKNHYYAIVKSDGDNMGSILESIGNDSEAIRRFSKQCFKYAVSAAQIIGDYGGVTLYAGGDDLLFIAPLEASKSKLTIFDLITDLYACFNEAFIFSKELDDKLISLKKKPSVSFGIAVRYKKYPLYEAFNSADALLRQAKDICIDKAHDKNNVVIDLQKHSGSSLKIMIHDFSNNKSAKDMSALCKEYVDGNFLKSVAYKLSEFSTLFRYAYDTNTMHNAFNNTFDSVDEHINDHENAAFIHKVMDFYAQLNNIMVIESNNDLNRLSIVIKTLQLVKFFSEPAGDEERRDIK